ncbi:hypothetical protein Lalb_Chr00c29g0408151 (mitochondrion) [Lupinus albus]|uniref:Uncharacterized protein n=1 Tax=Lupinus albus TaxID=3870 RepID=A0A6A4MIP8_LUPAL|nr:hypothetical protein Lalb_Chr00c29g0408151 [Lupinus albus]
MPCSMLTHLSDIVTIGSRRHKLPPLSISLDPFIGIGFRTGVCWAGMPPFPSLYDLWAFPL